MGWNFKLLINKGNPLILATVAFNATKRNRLSTPCKAQANGSNNYQKCWDLFAKSVFVCQKYLLGAKSLTGFKICQLTGNRVWKQTQHVTFNNVGSFWSTMLRPFARSFRESGFREWYRNTVPKIQYLDSRIQDCLGFPLAEIWGGSDKGINSRIYGVKMRENRAF